MDILLEPENLRREYLLTSAGSQEINGTYSQNSEDGMFYNKRAATSDPPGIIFVITLDSLTDKGEDFDIAWVLQSHDTTSNEVVTFYAAPCDDPDSLGLPVKGWTAISGLEPLPRVFARPKQQPRDRASTLDIIEEDEEVDFSLDPFWAPDEDQGSEEDPGDLDQFYDWDEIRDDVDEEYEDGEMGEFEEQSSEGDSDYGEVELPDDLMANFRDGHFGHKAEGRTSHSSEVDEKTKTSISSEVVNEKGMDLISRPGEGDEKEEQPPVPAAQNVKIVRAGGVNSALNQQLVFARNRGGVPLVDQRQKPINGSLYGCKVLKRGSREEAAIRMLITPVKDQFSPANPRYRKRSLDGKQFDVDLITAVLDTSESRTVQRRARRNSGEKSPDRNRRRRMRTPPVNVETLVATDEVGTGKEVKVDQKMSQSSGRKDDPERLKLERELHLLKTKMRKCDRLSKLRDRGRSLTKEQQETLVNKSKHQHRIDELRRALGSDVGRS